MRDCDRRNVDGGRSGRETVPPVQPERPREKTHVPHERTHTGLHPPRRHPDGQASEEYVGEVVVDQRSFDQHATADCTYRLSWPEAEVRVTSSMRVDVTARGYDVEISLEAYEGTDLVRQRSWREHLPR